MRLRRFLIGMLSVAVLFAAATIPALADSNRVGTLPPGTTTFETTVVTADTASVGDMGAGTLIYGFSVVVTTDGGIGSIYDVATLGAASDTQGIFIDEGGGGADGDTFMSRWPAPYKLKTDLTVVANNCNVIIYHDEL